MTHRHPGMKAQVSVAGSTRHLVSIALQEKANATLVICRQKTVLYPGGCVKSAIK